MINGMVKKEMIAAIVKVVCMESRSLANPKTGKVNTDVLKLMVMKRPLSRAGWSDLDSLIVAMKSGVVA